MKLYNREIESAIQGLMLLGRTREEAIKEIWRNDQEQYEKQKSELWDINPLTGKEW